MLSWLLTQTPILYLTQSLWRDEAFSVLAAQQPLSFYFSKLGLEMPLYYILLHGWVKLFGTSEIAVRSLSLMAFALATIVVIFWAEKLFEKHWLSWGLPILFFLNPMLLYYAFEVRAYGLAILFSVLTMYAYSEKRWKLFTVASLLGFYTHSYLIFIPLVSALHHMLWTPKKHLHAKKIVADPMVRSMGIYLLGILPWFIKLASTVGNLKTSWYFPVDMQLVKSVFGNLFIGYEGTPWGLWKNTFYLSILLIVAGLFALREKKTRTIVSYFALMMWVPVILIVGVSFFKPLYVNRYLLYVAIAQTALIAYAIYGFQKRNVQLLCMAGVIGFLCWFQSWYPAAHAKVDVRTTMQEVNALAQPNDMIITENALNFFETRYYSKNPQIVYIYNPTDEPVPWYIGDTLISTDRLVNTLPAYPHRAFMIRTDGTYQIVYRSAYAKQ